jgi:nitrite reductase (NAD(P)H)
MNSPDLSTRLKLMGVDVASFGDYFADLRAPDLPPTSPGQVALAPKPSQSQLRLAYGGEVKCLTYHDPFASTYKKYIFSADGRHLLGGMMIGDVGDYTKLVAICKKKKKLDVPPAQFILGSKSDTNDADELDDDAVVCSCHVRGSQSLS